MKVVNFSRKGSFRYLGGIGIATGTLLFMFLWFGAAPASAHTTVNVEQYEIDVGWGLEPPVVGIRNDFVFKIIERGEREGSYAGITNAFTNLEATAMYGGVTKKIDVNSDPRPGYYYSPVIPTKTGTIMINLVGEINGVGVDVKIPIEDVESTAILDFPQRKSDASSAEINSLKNTLAFLQKEISIIKDSRAGSEIRTDYDFVIFSLSLGVAAVILSIVAMTRYKKSSV